MTASAAHSFIHRSSMKSTRMIELRMTIPAPAMKPIMDVAVKNAPWRRARENPNQRKRYRSHDDERCQKGLKPPNIKM